MAGLLHKVLLLMVASAVVVDAEVQYIDSDNEPPLPFGKDNYCEDEGPICFRNRNGAPIPSCLPPPGPVKKRTFIKINLNANDSYHCPGKAYLCGYSKIPMDRLGNGKVKCCEAAGVTYRDEDCIEYYRVAGHADASPTESGYFLVSAVPRHLHDVLGFQNKECHFMKI